MKRILCFFLSIVYLYAGAQTLSTSLTACYALDGNANDAINGLNGTLSSVTSTVNRFGNTNSAYYFSGTSSSYIQLPNNPLLKPTNALSFSAWVKPGTMPSGIGSYILFTKNATTSNFESYALVIYNGPSGYKFRVAKGDGAGNVVNVDGTTSIFTNTWYHVSFTMDNSQLKIYINGTLEATTTTTYNFSYDATRNVYFGGTNETYNLPFQGTIDNARFYNRILSSTEISQLYLTDPNCTLAAGQAINCDGINDYIDPNVIVTTFTNNFTIESWVRPTGTIAAVTQASSGITGISGQRYMLWPTWRNLDGGIGISVGTNGVNVFEHGSNFIPPLLVWTGTITAWTHIAVVVTNKQPALYINGTLVQTGLTSSRSNVYASLGAGGTYPGQSGGIGGGTYGYYEGDIDEFRIWTITRTQSQIASTMNTEFTTCNPPGLFAYYKFNHGIASANNSTVTSALDYSGNNYTGALTNYTLVGNTSNWIAPGATLTPSGIISITTTASQSTLNCPGQSTTLTATGATSYTWLPGSLTGSNITVNPLVTTNYTVIGSNGACSGTTNLAITVNTPSISVAASQASICQGGSAVLSANNAVSYTWQPVNLSGSSITVSPSSSTVYTVTGTNSLGCTSSSTLLLTVNPNPTINASASSSTICAGATVSLSAIGGSTYTWSPVGMNGSLITVTPTLSTAYTVTGSLSGCTGTNVVVVIVNALPTLTVAASPASVCPGNSLTLSAAGAVNYTWQPGGIFTPSFTTTLLSSTVFTVNGASANGCRSFTTISVSTAPNPSIVLSSSQNSVCSGYSATLSATGAQSYTFFPGSITGSVLTVTPTAPSSTYTVSGTNSSGCTSTVTLLISVINCTLPTPDCNSVFYSTATGSNVIYANSASGSTLYPSILPPGAEGLAIGPAFSFPAPNPTYWTVAGGTYWYHNGNTFVNTGHGTGNAVALSPGGSKTKLYNITSAGQVYVYTGTGVGTLLTTIFANGNVSDIVGDDLDNFYVLSCCGSSTLRLYNAAGAWLCTYTPSSATVVASSGSAGGLAILNNTVIVHTGNIPGLQIGTLSGSTINFSTNTLVTGFADYANCPLPSGFTSSITASPVSSITCYNPSITLTANDNNMFGPSTYTWSGPGTISTPNSQSITVTSSGVYTCFLKSCPGYTSICTFTVNTNNSFSINVSASSPTLCSGSTGITLTANGANIYTWTPSASLSNTSSPVVVANPGTTTSYTVTGWTGLCSANSVITLTVFPTPFVNVASPTVGICSGTSATITANSPLPLTYNWSPGNLNGQTITISPLGATIYTVTGTDGMGCSASTTLSALILANPSVQVNAPKNPKCPDEQVLLIASGAASYTWFPGSINTPSLLASSNVTSTYSVTGINAFGCSNTLLYTMSVSPQSTILITSPNFTICSGSTASLLASGSSNYSWTPSGSLSIPIGPLVYANPSVTTVYTVNANNSVCSSSAMVTVSVIPNPSISVSPQTLSICPGKLATFTASGASNYTWLPSNQTGSIINLGSLTSTTFTLNGSNGNGCNASAIASLVVNDYPLLQITTSSSSLCVGESATLIAQGASNYTWLPPGLTGNSVVFSPTVTTSYTVIGANGVCTTTIPLQLLVSKCTPNIFFGLTNAADNPVPFNSNYYRINFTVIAVNTSSLNLSNVVLNSDLQKTFPSPISYSVVSGPRIISLNSLLTLNSSFDGSSQTSLTSSLTSVLRANKKDTLAYSVLVEPNGFYGPVKNSVVGFATLPDNTVLSDSSNNGFTWDPDQDGNPTNNNIATLIDIKPLELFIPEGFSPNDDGENDLFIIKGLYGKAARLTIYNRWGNKVFSKEGLDLSWDGKVNVNAVMYGNDKLPPSTYFYTLELFEGSKQTINGFIVMRY